MACFKFKQMKISFYFVFMACFFHSVLCFRCSSTLMDAVVQLSSLRVPFLHMKTLQFIISSIHFWLVLIFLTTHILLEIFLFMSQEANMSLSRVYKSKHVHAWWLDTNQFHERCLHPSQPVWLSITTLSLSALGVGGYISCSNLAGVTQC